MQAEHAACSLQSRRVTQCPELETRSLGPLWVSARFVPWLRKLRVSPACLSPRCAKARCVPWPASCHGLLRAMACCEPWPTQCHMVCAICSYWHARRY